jgi:hypothetical protein
MEKESKSSILVSKETIKKLNKLKAKKTLVSGEKVTNESIILELVDKELEKNNA